MVVTHPYFFFSKAMFLGKWTVHSGMREEFVPSAGKVEQLSKKENKFVMSLSPIVIQQDLYCVSTTSSAGIHRRILTTVCHFIVMSSVCMYDTLIIIA